MNDARLPSFGLSRWDMLPFRDESTIGFFLRMVEREGDDSSKRFAYLNGLTETSVKAEEVVDFLEQYPFPDDVKELIRGSRAVAMGKHGTSHRFSLRGELLNSEDLDLTGRRWCRACLSESDHRRLWWEVLPIRRCPYHGLLIERELRSGRTIPFYRTSYREVMEEGLEKLPRNLRTGSFGHYALSRLDCGETFGSSALDAMPLCDVIDVAQNLGTLLSGPWRLFPPSEYGVDDIETGFETLTAGPGHLSTVMLRWAEANVPADRRRGAAQDAFTWFYHRTQQMPRDLASTLVMKAIHAVNAALRGSPRELTDEYVMSELIALDTAAGRLGVAKKTFAGIVKELGLIENEAIRRRRGMAECDLPRVEKFLDGLVDHREFSRMIGLKRFRHLVDEGFARSYSGAIRGKPGPWLVREDAESILNMLAALPTTGKTDIGRTFNSAAAMSAGRTRLSLDVLKGRVAIASFRKRDRGFAGLVVETQDTRRVPRFEMGRDIVKATEAAKVLGVQCRMLRDITDAGLIEAQFDKRGQRLFRRADLEAFIETNVQRSSIAKALGVYRERLSRLIEESGVRPVIKIKIGKTTTAFYNRAEIMTALDLERDPASLDAPELERFWNGFIAAVKSKVPSLRVPVKFPFEGCSGSNSFSRVVVRFGYEADRQVLSATMSLPEQRGKRFEFDVTQEATPDIFDGLFKALDEATETTRRRAAAYARKYRTRVRARAANAQAELPSDAADGEP